MIAFVGTIICLMVFFPITQQTPAVSYNQPELCPNATWEPNATTFAEYPTISSPPYNIFVNTNNTVYLTDTFNNRVVMWLEGSTSITKIISGGLYLPVSLFVTINGDLYVDNGAENSRVDKWTLNATNSTPAMYVSSRCYGLFVDINDNLYCSMSALHQIIMNSPSNGMNILTVVAGTGFGGISPQMLDSPSGIFVDININLYVADSANNRIQLFLAGQLNGTTVAGNGVSGSILLGWPTDIVLDADGYLFIADRDNNRIVASGPNGFRCIVGCSGSSGSASNQLSSPLSLSFDSYGNIFVADTVNNRVQTFLLATNLCDATTATQRTVTSTAHTIDTSISLTSLKSPSTSAMVTNVRNNSSSISVSYNQPKFCPSATWNPDATTFAKQDTIGAYPFTVFVNTNNTVYLTDTFNNRTLMWVEESTSITKIISGGLSYPVSLFVTSNGDLYVDNGAGNGRVDKWTSNATNSTPAMYVSSWCTGLFVDTNDNLYCSMYALHQVGMTSQNDDVKVTTVVAGTGRSGSSSNTLNNPWGIFIDTNLDLYVADSANNRIQLFLAGQLNGTTVAGNGVSGTIALSGPTDIVLDADGYLFITDRDNNRIVASGPNGFRCIVGCSGSSGSASNQLSSPLSLSFDSYGNIFVADTVNNRVQTFLLATDSCEPFTTLQQTTTSTVYIVTRSTNISTSASRPDVSMTSLSTDSTASTSLLHTLNPLDTSLDTPVPETSTAATLVVNQTTVDTDTADKSSMNSIFDLSTAMRSTSVTASTEKIATSVESSSAAHSSIPSTTVSTNQVALMTTIGNTMNMSHETSTLLDLFTASALSTRHKITTPTSGTDKWSLTSDNNTTSVISISNNLDAQVVISTSVHPMISTTTIAEIPSTISANSQSSMGSASSTASQSATFTSIHPILSTTTTAEIPSTINTNSQSSMRSASSTASQSKTSTSIHPILSSTTTTAKVSSNTNTNSESNMISIGSAIAHWTTLPIKNISLVLPFVPLLCADRTQIGVSCNIPTTPCNLLQPCQNDGNCHSTNTTPHGYNCSCVSGFNGTNCEIDLRPCQPNTCWNRGVCNETSRNTYNCTCPSGWTGVHCEEEVNDCDGVQCLNNGVCRPLLLNFTCECLGTSYSGRHCEIVARKIVFYRTVSKSTASTAILIMSAVALFVIVMDVLKYLVGIDLTENEVKKIRKKKRVKHHPIALRFMYVHQSIPTIVIHPTTTSEETNV